MSEHQGWEKETVYVDAQLYFETLIDEINRAQKTLEIAVYIFNLDSIGVSILDALLDALARGVHVRLMVDGIGTAEYVEEIAEKLSRAGGGVKVFHPLPWRFRIYKWSLQQGSFFDKYLYFHKKVNRRDHRKLIIIDQKKAWCGSLNFTADHTGVANPWRDYGVQLEGEPVADLLNHYDSVWSQRKYAIKRRQLKHFHVNTPFRLRRLKNRLLLKKISNAKERVWVSNAYFSPSRSLIKAIKKACKRNVDVRFVVADKSDIPAFPMLASTYYADLIKLGVKIYAYQRGMLHAKVLLIDEACLVGSTNLNNRSFFHDLELDVILSKPETIKAIQEYLIEDMNGSRKVELNDMSWLRRNLLFGWALRIIRYWM